MEEKLIKEIDGIIKGLKIMDNIPEPSMSEDEEDRLHFERSWEAKCPPIYFGTDKEKLSSKGKAAWDAVTNYEKGVLMFFGPPRAGKTRLAYLAAYSAYKRNKKYGMDSLQVFTGAMFTASATEAYREGKEKDFFNTCSNRFLFFIDDLGSAKLTERTGEALFEIIERRMQVGGLIIITTNFTGPTLIKRFDDETRGTAVIDRLEEMSTTIIL